MPKKVSKEGQTREGFAKFLAYASSARRERARLIKYCGLRFSKTTLRKNTSRVKYKIMNIGVEKAIKTLNQGGIIIFPTDTVWGMGCRIDRPEAIDRLFRIRRRPLTQATPALVSEIEMALAYWDSPSQIVRHLVEKYWPGALTIIYKCKKNLVYSPVRGGRENLGLRMPNQPQLLKIIKQVGVPILGPSANFHGGKTPVNQTDLDPEIIKLVDYVLPGITTSGQASTVVDCSQEPYRILRQGALRLS